MKQYRQVFLSVEAELQIREYFESLPSFDLSDKIEAINILMT